MHWLLAILTAFTLTPAWSQPPSWQYHAARLSGRSEWVHQSSVQALRKIKQIEKTLGEALKTPDKYLALDAIAALSLHGLLPELMQASYQDELGAVHQTINALITAENAGSIAAFYTERLAGLSEAALSVPAHTAVLDVLGRLQHELPERQVAAQLAAPDFDIRSAALYYIRLIQRGRKKPAYLESVRQALRDPAYLLRLQAVHTLRDRNYPKPESWDGLVALCAQDTDAQVKAACLELKR